MRTAFLPFGVLLAISLNLQAAVLTTNTTLGVSDTWLEGQELVVSNCVLTLDGPHHLASLRLAGSATLTHSPADTGLLTLGVAVQDEPQLLSGTNAVSLSHSNVLSSGLQVRESGSSRVYSNSLDYVLSSLQGWSFVQRTETSSIPDGSTVLISYQFSLGTTNSGLNLSVDGDLEVEAGAAISADGRGYLYPYGEGRGQFSGSPSSGGGGGHGGAGGNSSSNGIGGLSFDELLEPVDKGGGGGLGSSRVGGNGGGAIRLTVGGSLTVNGRISATGANALNNRSGGGAGGSVWLSGPSISGAGLISVDGGAGEPIHGGGGGGGRLALVFATNSFSGSLLARGGSGFIYGGAGTLCLQRSPEAAAQVLLDNGGHIGARSPLGLTNAAALTLSGGAIGSASGSLTLATLRVGSASRLEAVSLSLLVVSNATVEATGAIGLDGVVSGGEGMGGAYSYTSFPSSSTTYWGGGGGHAGYGGASGNASAPAGSPYGLLIAPTSTGSRGGGNNFGSLGGNGGGALRLSVLGTLQLDGLLSAQGSPGLAAGGGGGSGGSLWLTVGRLAGSGWLSANGGDGLGTTGGGGSGGRVAVEFESNLFSGTMSACGGQGINAGSAGTLYLKEAAHPPTLLLDNANRVGTNTPVSLSGPYRLSCIGGARVFTPGPLELTSLRLGSNSLLMAGSSNLQLTVSGDVLVEKAGAIRVDGMSLGVGPYSGVGRFYTYGGIGGEFGGGGGHGGCGGSSAIAWAPGGPASADALEAPILTGSRGGGPDLASGSVAGAGGGALRLNIAGALRLEGELSANGAEALARGAGGGAGGSLWVTAAQLSGDGLLLANGGNGHLPYGGGGGGGCIAVELTGPPTTSWSGRLRALGGTGAHRGGPGTLFTRLPGQTPTLLVDGEGLTGATNTFLFGLSNYVLQVRGGAVVTVINSNLSLSGLLLSSNATLSPRPYPASASRLTINGPALIEAGGSLSADGLGYPASYYYSTGSGASSSSAGGGGGYGGFGGSGISSNGVIRRGGQPYGSVFAPQSYGSGGGGYTVERDGGGAGGGVVLLTVNGTLQLEGTLSAKGSSALDTNCGGGSGGSISLAAWNLIGSGSISANGGQGKGVQGGGGGGGRILLSLLTNQFSGSVSAFGGTGYGAGGAGTLYYAAAPERTDGLLLLDNGGLSGTNTALPETSDCTLVVGGGAVAIPAFDGLFASFRSLTLRSNGWLKVGGGLETILLIHSNATIEAGAGILASSVDSSRWGSQPGGTNGTLRGGAGHGGYGGANVFFGGGAYDSIQAPTYPGSSGANGGGLSPSLGGLGGGNLHLTVKHSLTVNGLLSANGLAGALDSGGGSGGSLWLTLGGLTGSGSISAQGGAGNGSGGGGGGGRIALYYASNDFAGSLSVAGGNGSVGGGAGTLYSKAESESVGRLVIDNNGLVGTNTPLSTSLGLPSLPVDLSLQGGASLQCPGAIPVFKSLRLSSGAQLTSTAGQTNTELAVLGDVTVEPGSAISLDAKGSSQGAGGGAGSSSQGQGGGGAYGGNGGAAASGAAGGIAYGSASQPAQLGSGGGLGTGASLGGSQGGGALRLTVGGKLHIDGRLSANGATGLQDNSGGGAGGALWVVANQLSGSGSIEAEGGWGELYNGGGGGGGRIALYSATNTFSGLLSVLGGQGAVAGEPGSVFTSASFDALRVIAQTPTGLLTNGVSAIELTFNSPVEPSSLSSADVQLRTPLGLLQPTNLALSALSPSRWRVGFPLQTTVGDYALEVGPQIQDFWGQPMSLVHTGAFTLLLPTIEGTVSDTNGAPVAGVLLLPSGQQSAATSDALGHYSVGVNPGWSGTLSASLAGVMFIPGAHSYSNVLSSLSGQNFLMVSTIAPALSLGQAGTNLLMRWSAMAGVSYKAFSSTNLQDWVALGSALSGTNGVLELQLPREAEAKKFYRLQAAD